MSTAAAPVRTGAVLADLLPAARHRYAVDTALVVGGAALTGIAAQIAVPVPGSPVLDREVDPQEQQHLRVGEQLPSGHLRGRAVPGS
ncbi:hypothetical protein ACWD8L_31235, partial [Streptomyces sp. NPDC005133]